MRIAAICLAPAASLALPGRSGGKPANEVELLNVSYDWGSAQKKFFDDGGVFNSLYSGIRRR